MFTQGRQLEIVVTSHACQLSLVKLSIVVVFSVVETLVTPVFTELSVKQKSPSDYDESLRRVRV